MVVLHAHNFFYYVDNVWKKELHNQLKGQWFYGGSDLEYDEDDEILLQFIEGRRRWYTPNTGEPLKFFEWFYDKGINLFIEYFQNAPQIQYGRRLLSIKRQTNYFQEILIQEGPQKNQTNIVVIDFKSELKKLFTYQYAKIKTLLKEQLAKSTDISALHTYLLYVQQKIESFRPNKLPPEVYNEIFESIFTATKEQIAAAVNELLERSGYSKIEVDVKILSPKKRQNLLLEIYKMDIGSGQFIVDTPKSQEDFLQYFANHKDIRKNQVEFFIGCKSNEAAIVLDRMKQLGFPISFEEIDRRKIFKISKTSHLTAGYISKALSLARKKQSPRTLNEINAFFHDLESRYFFKKG